MELKVAALLVDIFKVLPDDRAVAFPQTVHRGPNATRMRQDEFPRQHRLPLGGLANLPGVKAVGVLEPGRGEVVGGVVDAAAALVPLHLVPQGREAGLGGVRGQEIFQVVKERHVQLREFHGPDHTDDGVEQAQSHCKKMTKR